MTAEGLELALRAGASVARRVGWRLKMIWAPNGPLSGLDPYAVALWMGGPDFILGDLSRTHLARLEELS